MARFQRDGTIAIEKKLGSGLPTVKITAGKKRRLIRAARDKKAVATRNLASKFAIDRSYVTKILKKKEEESTCSHS